MKKTLLTILAAALLFSCSKEDDKSEPEYTASYKDQPAQGKIEGTNFEYFTGTFVKDFHNTENFRIHLYDKAEIDTVDVNRMCGFAFYGTTRECYFSIPKKVGIHKLYNNQSVTFVTGEINVALPRAIKGEIEIISISDTQLVGKIDAKESDANYINGNFTVVFCDKEY
jgi:hypothetical protein